MIVIISKANGGVSLMRFTADDVTDDHVNLHVERWKETALGEYVSHRIGSEEELPDLPTSPLRNAWCDTNGKLSVDMPKARSIWKERMRIARAPKLAELDTAFQRAIEADDKAAMQEIAREKQALRDVTADPAIDEAKTPDALMAVWPDNLGEREKSPDHAVDAPPQGNGAQ